MRKSFWITLAVMFVAVSTAHADTFDVSGTLTAVSGTGAACPQPCVLGGTIEINTVTGVVGSVDVTFTGESPSLGPFTVFHSLGTSGTETQVLLFDTADNILTLIFTTPTLGSLVGYTGGPLNSGTNVEFAAGPPFRPLWPLLGGTGALTPATATAPVPSSVVLMLLGVGLLFVLRKRNSRGHQPAT